METSHYVVDSPEGQRLRGIKELTGPETDYFKSKGFTLRQYTPLRCDCFFCMKGRKHPETEAHSTWHPLSSRLIVAESLDPRDRVPVKACTICGHQTEGSIDE